MIPTPHSGTPVLFLQRLLAAALVAFPAAPVAEAAPQAPLVATPSASPPPALVLAGEPAAVSVLVDDLPGAGDLCAPASGQMVYVIDDERHGVVAVDPFDATKRWTAVSPPGSTAVVPPGSTAVVPPGSTAVAPPPAGGIGPRRPTPVVIGCIDSGTLVLLCQSEGEWSLRTHRLAPPGSAVNPGEPLQTISLGKAADLRDGRSVAPTIAVSHSRDWLVVVGLPSPLPAVLQAPIAGARLGAISTRRCPILPAAVQPTAATVSPFDELVLFTAEAAAPAGTATALASFHSPLGPRRLLHVDTGLTNVRDASYCRADGSLWVVGGEPKSPTCPEGLWRIDAVMRESRQAVRAVCVAKLSAPRSLVCLSERAIVVSCGIGPAGQDGNRPEKIGPGKSRVVLVDPTSAGPTSAGPTSAGPTSAGPATVDRPAP